jgi:hypothetical protein
MKQSVWLANHGPQNARTKILFEANQIYIIVILLCSWSMMALPVAHSFSLFPERSSQPFQRSLSRIPHLPNRQRQALGYETSDKLRPGTSRVVYSASLSSSLLVLAATNKGNTIDDGYEGLGEYDPSEGLRPEREVVVGDPQLRVMEKEQSFTSILKELAAIQQQGPQKYCILGTRHCSYLHQQIIELLYVVL